MQIQQSQAVAFLVELGFPKAAEWDTEKMIQRLGEVPSRITEEAVTKSFVPLFRELVAAKGKVEIVPDEAGGEAGEGGDEKDRGEEGAKEDKKSAAKPAPKDKAKDKKAAKPAAKPAAKSAPAKDKKAATPAKAKDKKAAASKPSVPKDEFGATQGTKKASVNKHVSAKWQTVEEIAEAAGTQPRQTKLQLRKLLKQFPKQFEKRRRVEYRFKQEEKK